MRLIIQATRYHGTYVSPSALGTPGPNPPYIGFDNIDNVAPLFDYALTGTHICIYASVWSHFIQYDICRLIYPIGVTTNVQAPSAGIIFNRSSTTSGLCYKNDGNQLGYNWNNDAATYGYSSGLVPPTNQWSFVAVVVTPTNAILYLYNNAGDGNECECG